VIETLGIAIVVAGCLVWLLAIAANQIKDLPECKGLDEEKRE